MLGIVNSHNGFINVYSEAGQGTKFTIYLPANITERTAPPAVKYDEMPAGQGELSLVIDDEAKVRDITRSTLETFGYRVLYTPLDCGAIGSKEYELSHSAVTSIA